MNVWKTAGMELTTGRAKGCQMEVQANLGFVFVLSRHMLCSLCLWVLWNKTSMFQHFRICAWYSILRIKLLLFCQSCSLEVVAHTLML